jgi:hypothetical protein
VLAATATVRLGLAWRYAADALAEEAHMVDAAGVAAAWELVAGDEMDVEDGDDGNDDEDVEDSNDLLTTEEAIHAAS